MGFEAFNAQSPIWLVVGVLVLIPVLGFAFANNAQLFGTEIEAQKHCPADIVVWVNTPTGIYHFRGMRWYGNTNRSRMSAKKRECRQAIELLGMGNSCLHLLEQPMVGFAGL